MFRGTFREFALNTSMHGVKYIVDEKKRPAERIFWAIFLILSIGGCIYMVAVLWNTFISKPVRIYTESNQAATNVIPFPAVTICNTNIISKAKVKEFVNQLHLYGEKRATLENALAALLAFRFKLRLEFERRDLEIVQRILERNRYTIAEVMRNIGRTCDEVLVKCSWNGRIVPKCSSIFQESVSSRGFCCSFNSHIKFTKGNSSEKSSYKYTLYPGFMMGLSVLLDSHEENHKISYRSTNGMEVAIHHSDDYPGPRTYRKTLPTGFQTFLQVSGTTIRASEEVAKLSADERGCIFSSEYQLRLFKKYTQDNCFVECETLYILNKCGCVPYFYDFGAAPVCRSTSIPCLYNIKYRNYSKIECNCPLKCATVNYDVLASDTYIVNSEASTWSFMTDANITKDSILLTVFFVSEGQQIYRIDVIYSRIHLLASFGGIFGLFLGWSFITGAEIVYYFLVKVIVKQKANSRTEKRSKKGKMRRPSFIYEPRAYLP